MACRDTINVGNEIAMAAPEQMKGMEEQRNASDATFYFGVDSISRADTVLQNNLTLFDWATRNKMYPNYWGRYIGGRNAITAEELAFLHEKGCKVALIYNGANMNEMRLSQQGTIDGKKASMAAAELGVPAGTAVFLEVNATAAVTDEYLKGYGEALIQDGYTPGFCANTDSACDFDHQFSRGHYNYPEIFSQCLIWSVTPSLPEYYQTRETHRLYPDVWEPFAPSHMTPSQIAVWQYGRECHPISDRSGNMLSFDIGIIKDTSVLLEKMY